MLLPHASPLGLKRSFGFGDRIGLATPGHIAAARRYDFAPVFAQQSIRELDRMQRTPQEVMGAAQSAVVASGYMGPWGADADHLKTRDDVQRMAGAGFCFFTIDSSDYVENAADTMDEEALEVRCAELVAEDVFACGWTDSYLGKVFEVLGLDYGLEFNRESLLRAAVKYGRTLDHIKRMSVWTAMASGDRPSEIEVSVDETDSPTSPLEHLFLGLELMRREVRVASLAPRFVGDFEKGIDYRGDLTVFEHALKAHLAIAKFCGPYKISVHSAGDKVSIFPICGRICGPLLHVKTAGTSYLEALRIVAHHDLALFKEIAAFSVGRFDADRDSYFVSTTAAEVAALAAGTPANWETAYLEKRVGRQLLHVTYGSVLTEGQRSSGRPFKQAIMELLRKHASDYEAGLFAQFDKQLRLLTEG